MDTFNGVENMKRLREIIHPYRDRYPFALGGFHSLKEKFTDSLLATAFFLMLSTAFGIYDIFAHHDVPSTALVISVALTVILLIITLAFWLFCKQKETEERKAIRSVIKREDRELMAKLLRDSVTELTGFDVENKRMLGSAMNLMTGTKNEFMDALTYVFFEGGFQSDVRFINREHNRIVSDKNREAQLANL